jgi:hypothetical protein
LSHAQRDALADDASGDRLDAVLCLVQAAWASRQERFGLPLQVDPLEGWIVSAPSPAAVDPVGKADTLKPRGAMVRS